MRKKALALLGVSLATPLWLVAVYPQAALWVVAAFTENGYDPSGFILQRRVMFQLAGMGLVYLGLAYVTSRYLGRYRWRPRPFATILADQNGALVFEFALVFPFILALIFILFQWAELLMVESLVHYAAFASCRTAATYAAAPPSRFDLTPKEDSMRRAAEAALAGAKALEGSSTHQAARVSYVEGPGGSASTAIRYPGSGGGAYRHVTLKVLWGFFPRWPLAQLFFWPIVDRVEDRIQIECDYLMQTEGYYRSPSLQNTGTSGQDRYASPDRMEDTGKREGLTQKALYQTVLPEGHSPSGAVQGTRSPLAAGSSGGTP
ncbi:MAG: pilus assembly protein [Candidatus Riflebacteria bacterium]|nr:pilus assembly protein [Candidatus Riflebacteria bacterium]